jgi:hypothetical protein
LAGVIVAGGVALADKPSSPPADPHVEGREPTPIAREFHLPDPVNRGSGRIEWQIKPSGEQVRDLALLLFSFCH